MVIDEKRLEQFKIKWRTSGHGENSPIIVDEGCYADESALRDLIRLARLGLLFEKVLKDRVDLESFYEKYLMPAAREAGRIRDETILEALAALPKAVGG